MEAFLICRMDLNDAGRKIEFGNLEMLARQAVEGFIIGLHKSPFHGFSVEFAEHQHYNRGDSTKNIDWKVYARSEKLFVKKFEEETNLRCQLVIDCSSSMYFPKEGRNKFEFSCLSAAALMNLLKKQRDAFGLSLFDEEVIEHLKPRSSNKHYKLLIAALERQLQKSNEERGSRVSQALHQIAESIHRRSLVIVFSDMMENREQAEELFSALQHLRYNKHEVILFHTLDYKRELEFDYPDRPYKFVDMETGESMQLHPKEIKANYQEKMTAFLKEIELKCLQYKIDFVPADISQGVQKVLQTYLVKRRKMNV
ncbi:MAG TPA: DUF58 domain-containing protein [Saprospiraceae bacterium]|nr:DUF58 domain-containing protein [Saprospiraceae bacterium]